MTNSAADSSSDLHLSPIPAGQFSYHLRMAAAFAAAGRNEASASESMIAWSMLLTCWPQAASEASEVASELVDPDMVIVTKQQQERAQMRARDLAMSLQSHFVSVGFHEHASLYESVAARIEPTVDELVDPLK